jgi:hypothetical protein
MPFDFCLMAVMFVPSLDNSLVSVKTCSLDRCLKPLWIIGGVTMGINMEEAPDNLWDILTQTTYNRTFIVCQTHLGVRVDWTAAKWPLSCSCPLHLLLSICVGPGPPSNPIPRVLMFKPKQ